ncbi:MAG TPA: DNA gyrase modulator, partial [Candidatus Limnocylindria bacterium]|nr:DNA gyrase modulator [Candidatus Limnocylindria bacterium]
MTLFGADAILGPLRGALQGATGDEAELWAHRRRSAITRYAKNEVHQNAVADEWYVQARVAVKGAVGIASANSLEPADLRRSLADARAAAEVSIPNAEWPGLAVPEAIGQPTAFDPPTAEVDARRQAEDIR